METVKVDIQKLQLLNDRIAQTIEALGQLRMTVQGIHHAPYAPYGYVSPFGFSQPYGGLPYQVQSYGSPFVQSPFVQSPFGLQHAMPPTAFAPTFTPTPFSSWSVPFTGNGISHTTWDPAWQTRTQWPYPVTIS